MKKATSDQSAGRQANAAQPPGEQLGIVSNEGLIKTGKRSRRAAGPDGPDAKAVGNTFKAKPGRG